MPELQSLRVSWEVNAGILPGSRELEHRRQFHLTSAEWESAEGLLLFLQREAEAHAYARWLSLQCSQGRMVNWVEVTFLWY